MRRGRIFIYLALILLLGLGAAYYFLSSQGTAGGDEAAVGPAMVDVVIAGQPVAQGAQIIDEALGFISIPEDKINEQMYRYDQRTEQLVGQFARYPLDQGVVISSSMVVDTAGDIASTGPKWANLITPGMTAISLPVSRLSSVSYGVTNGARVNVIACFLFVDIDAAFQSILPNYTSYVSQITVAGEDQLVPSANSSSAVAEENSVNTDTATASVQRQDPSQGRVELEPSLQEPFYVIPSEAQRPRPVCQTIIQDVTVLKLGDFSGNEAAPVEGADGEAGTPPAPGEEQAPVNPDVVTLVVSPQDATSLTYMIYGGARLTLTLRSANDTSRVETEAATLQFLLSQYAIPVPAKLPYGVTPRIEELVEPVP